MNQSLNGSNMFKASYLFKFLIMLNSMKSFVGGKILERNELKNIMGGKEEYLCQCNGDYSGTASTPNGCAALCA
jgi:hypothetical protein|tara:strand:+ start:342 stop:563 length:222 start_codon:yes stop_codon:yes gene_type:complete